MKHPWVILFDIDGTLLTVEKSFNRPLLRSIVNDLNINYASVETDPFSGRTDHDILTSFLENHGFDQNLYAQLKSIYLNRITSELTYDHIIRHPFVDEAISFFSGPEFITGLLTGNYPNAAYAKLKAAKIKLSHEIGAYGDYHKDRNMLPKQALARFEEIHGYSGDPRRFIIIGDTPRDIECAKHSNMISVAVTTGMYTHDQLGEYSPDLILDTLKNPEIWFNQLTGENISQTSIQR